MHNLRAAIATAKRKKLLIAWLLVLPVLVIRLATTAYPTFSVFWYSLRDYSFLLRINEFSGFDNISYLLTDPKIGNSFSFTFTFTVVSIALMLLGGIALAHLLNVQFGGRRFLRTTALIPWALPMIVAGIAARWAFNDVYGIVNDLVRRFAGDFHYDWLVSPVGAQAAIIAVDFWKNVSFFAILTLAGLQNVPSELHESAKIDGAGPFTLLVRITLPHIQRTLIIVTLFFIMWRLSSFDIVYAMTKGGPGSSTSLLAYRMYEEAFKNLNIGYASSIAVALFVIMAVAGGAGILLYRRVDY